MTRQIYNHWPGCETSVREVVRARSGSTVVIGPRGVIKEYKLKNLHPCGGDSTGDRTLRKWAFVSTVLAAVTGRRNGAPRESKREGEACFVDA